jgi:hypothetical protein
MPGPAPGRPQRTCTHAALTPEERPSSGGSGGTDEELVWPYLTVCSWCTSDRGERVSSKLIRELV